MTDPSITVEAGEPSVASPPAGRSAGFGFIFVSALLNALSFGLMIPVLPNLIKHFLGGDFALASFWSFVFATTWGLMQFFFGPVLGMLSDRYGRRPVMLLSIGGLGVDTLQGGSADDILIGGTLSLSSNLTALIAIQKEWVSTDSYAVRVGNLRGPYGSGLDLNGTNYLNSQTIIIVTTIETLNGAGGTDWFWGNPLDLTDRVTTGALAETLN